MQKSSPRIKALRLTDDNTTKAFISDLRYRLLVRLIDAGKWITITYIIYMMVAVLADKETLAVFIIQAFVDNGTDDLFYYISTLLLLSWALIERIMRLRKVRYLGRRILKLEKRLDPDRSSSGLQDTGETNPRDE